MTMYIQEPIATPSRPANEPKSPRQAPMGMERTKPFLSVDDSKKMRAKADVFIDSLINKWHAEVPGANLMQQKDIHRGYYTRHLIETALRIRLLRVAETKAIAPISKISPEAAQIWAQYEMEEMLHDELFVADARAMGASDEQIFSTEPYLSTKLLSGFMSYLLEHESAMGVVAYSYLVESVNVKLDAGKVAALTNTLGADSVQGFASHTKTDVVEDHPGEVWEVLRYLIRSEKDQETLFTYFEEFQSLLAMYFTELYNEFYPSN